MSYGVCVFDPARLPPGRTPGDVWDDELYQAASTVDADRNARKWQIRDALMAFNPRLVFHEPKTPPGAIAQFFGAPVVLTRSLTLLIPAAQDEVIDFTLYDDAVEIELPFFATSEDARYYMTELWRHLEKLAALGFSVIYDIERDTELALETDFDAALEQYVQNLADDWAHSADDADETVSPQMPVPEIAPEPGKTDVYAMPRPQPPTLPSEPPSARPAAHAPPSPDEPFTGNVAAPRRWWKFW